MASNTVYKCTLCSQCFENPSDINAHMSLHLGHKKFECSLCGKKFFNEKSLDLHIKIHAKEIKYEALSTSSEEQMMISNEVDNMVVNSPGNIPQVKVRVKSFPVKSTQLQKDTYVSQPLDPNEMHMHLTGEEFGVIEESEVYTTEGEVFQEKKSPVQLKVWSRDQNYRQEAGASTANASSKIPYVIKVMNKNMDIPAVPDPNPVAVQEEQNRQPIRIFVGTNIRLENLEDLNPYTAPAEEFTPQESVPVNMCQEEQVYDYQSYPDEVYQGDAQDEEEIDNDLQSLQEVIEEGDLHSFQVDLNNKGLKTIEDVNLQIPQGHVVNNASVGSFQVSVGNGSVLHPQNVVVDGSVQASHLEGVGADMTAVLGHGNSELPHVEAEDVNTQQGSSQLSVEEVMSSEQDVGQLEKESSGHSLPEEELLDHNEDPLLCNEGNAEVEQSAEEKENKSGNSGVDEIGPMSDQDTSKKDSADVDESTPGKSDGEEDTMSESPENEKDPLQLSDLKKHVMRSNQRPHKCPICGLGFRFSFYLKAHLSIHSYKQSCDCITCGKSFKTQESLDRHQLTHQEQRSFQCTQCVRMFPSSPLLKKHMEMHVNPKQFECRMCPAKFSVHGRLKTHMKTHNVHKCYICDKVFKENSKLKRHINSHLTKKLHHCKICNRTLYCQPYDFQRHEMMHKDVVTCTHCLEEFESQELLTSHKLECPSKSPPSNQKDEEKPMDDASDSEDPKDVRSKVAETLINDLLKDMSEKDTKEGSYLYETPNWLEGASEGVTKEKFQNCISDCITKDDVLKQLSFYFANDIIKDGVSECLLRERIAVQKLSQLIDASEEMMASSDGRKGKRKRVG